MAQVAVSRALFAEILRLIDGLRQLLCRHDGASSRRTFIDRRNTRVLRCPDHTLKVRNGLLGSFLIANQPVSSDSSHCQF
jgi:hypothetical protein